jgi:hypothetical protein
MFTASVLTLLLAAGQDTHTLQWKLKEGDVFYNKSSVTMEQTIEVMGQKVDQTITTNTVLKFKVTSAKEGAAVVEMTYLEHKVDAKNLPGANIGDKLKNVSFTATLDKTLKVEKLEGYDKFLDALTGGDDDQKKVLRIIMPETTIRQMFSQTFVVGPGKPVAVGGTWARTTRIALGPLGNIETKEDLKLDAVKGDVATISVKADLVFKPAEGDGGLPFKITRADLKADKFTATHLFDKKAGRLTETKLDLELSGSMSLSIAGQTVDAKFAQKMKTVGVVTEKNPIVD